MAIADRSWRHPSSRSQASARTAALITILGLAAVLRVWGLEAQSLSMDEVYELAVARQSPGAIITTPDGLPPLYHLLLHWWTPWFGGDASARWLSVTVGVLTVAALYKLGTQVAGTTVGMVGAALLAIAPIHVYYSQEARAYGLSFLWAVLAVWLFLRARDSDATREWVGFAVVCSLGLYTHYYFSLLLPGFLLAVLLERRPRRPARRMLLTYAILALASLPWLWLALSDLSAQRAEPVPPPFRLASLGYTFFTFLAGYSIGPSLRELHTLSPGLAVRQVLPWALPLGLAAAYLGYLPLTDCDWRRRALRLLTVVAVPLALCGLLGMLLTVGYRVRYVSWAAAPLFTLFAMGVMRGWGKWQTSVATAVLVGVSLIAIYRRHAEPQYMTEDSRGAAGWIAANVGPSDPIFVSANYMAGPLTYYLGHRRELRALPHVIGPADLAANLSAIQATVAPGRPFWLVYSRPFHGDPKGSLLQVLRDRARLGLRRSLSGIELYEGRGF